MPESSATEESTTVPESSTTEESTTPALQHHQQIKVLIQETAGSSTPAPTPTPTPEQPKPVTPAPAPSGSVNRSNQKLTNILVLHMFGAVKIRWL